MFKEGQSVWDNDAHALFEGTGNLLLLMRCSGFHKESCFSAAAASLTSDTVPTELK